MKLKPIGKRGETDLMKLLIGLVLVVVLAQGLGFKTNFFGGPQAAAGGPVGTTTPSGGTATATGATPADCGFGTTTVTFSNANVLARGTSQTEFTRVFLDGKNSQGADLRVDKSQVAGGGTLTLAPGDHVIAYHAQNSTTDPTGYYNDKNEFVIGCVGALTDEGEIYQYDNGLTLSYKNQNGQVNTGQAVAANSKYDLDVTIRSSSQKAYGNPQLADRGKNALCFQYNNTIITSMDWKVGGVNQGVVPVPQIHSGNNTVTGMNAFRCFQMPIIKNTEKLEGVLHLESGATAGVNVNTINVTTEDLNYDLNADDLSEIVGIQDEDGNDMAFRGIFLTPIDITS